MKIFSSVQTKAWDAYTLNEQEISSHFLMERAANACYLWLLNNNFTHQPVQIFCGKGNNGGDGLALARILLEQHIPVTTYILELGKPGSSDFQLNLQQLHQVTNDIHFIQSENFFPCIEKNHLIIDAIFGSGLNKPLIGLALQLVEYINKAAGMIITIDIPSGLYSDKHTMPNAAIQATHTLCFQNTKLAFLMPENDKYVGEFHLLDIGLSKHYEEQENTSYEIIEECLIKNICKPRNKFSNKGSFGHASLIAGSHGMIGASILAAKGCMYSGTGKLTAFIPSCGYEIMQISVPEVMCKVSGEMHISAVGTLSPYDAVGIGPGIGTSNEISNLLKDIFETNLNALLLDADALNVLAENKALLSSLPKDTVITPHPKEFERMFGPAGNDFERLELAIKNAAALHIYIVLKGHYTAIVTPLGKVYFNNTGNAGMAKAGMGDVLSGIITGLLAQQYSLPEAALLGVYLHGLAGDIAAKKHTQQAMQASNLLNCMQDAWNKLV